MGNVVVGKEQAREAARASIAALEARLTHNVDALIRDIDKHIKSKTPVWSGQAVRNYIWQRGSGSSTVHEAIDNGPTGHTNRMALGSEPRRKPNEEAAAQSISTLNLSNPFGVFTLQNNSPDIVGLELGIYPGPPMPSRSPNGMFGITQAYFHEKLASKGILS